MKVLFDVSHPAHVHLFKHAIRALEEDGHEVLVLSREKDVTIQLLDGDGIDHLPISRIGTRKLSLLSEWLAREVRTIRMVKRFDPDVALCVMSPATAHAGRLLDCPVIAFNDSEPVKLASSVTLPFVDRLCTPTNFSIDHGDKHRTYDGYHELAYLHPDRFSPDPDSLRAFGVEPDEPYTVVRFVSWGAHHDVGQRGLSSEAKRELVSALDEYGTVYISSERPLPEEFDSYRLPIPPERMHDLLYYADLYVGDSQTMATEAAVLGTPAVRSNTFAGEADMSNFLELEDEYGLLYSRSDADETIELVRDLLELPDLQETWSAKRARLVEEKIDVTEYMLEQIYDVGGDA
ncbi:DUF354 domain-containing protein [Natronorubrum sp. DTA28]|uniref:DUF354 domain-containing protein n=1 Tax=Natronorubrum sp. DTA28 TaxID=3447019 RepID=UPI003F8611E4